jgi:hypothetical protein
MSTTAPALADDGDKAGSGDTCWVEAETGTTHCYADQAAMDSDLIRNYGGLPIEEGTPQALQAARGTAAAASMFTLAKLYRDASYGGTPWISVYATTSTFCSGGVVSKASMPSGWNDAVSSVESFYGCTTTLYDNINYGSVLGTYGDQASLGAANDRTSSYRVQ